MSAQSAPAFGWRTPLVVIVAGCTIALLNFGVRSGFGLFMEPISVANGWGREVFAFAIGVQTVLWGFGQPFAGAFADRYGSGRVLAVGAVFYAVGVALTAISSDPLTLTLTTGVLVGVGLAGTSFTVALAAIARMVSPERRSWALGLGTAAGSLGQFLMVPLGQAFIAAHGWAFALVLLSLFALAIVPLSTALAGKTPETAGPKQSMGEALKEAGGERSYWLLIAGFFVCGFHVSFIQTHLPAYVVDRGLDPRTGAWALALVGLANVIGSYTAGVLGGKHSKKYMLSFIYFARAIVITVFVLMPMTQTSVLIFAFFMGLLWLSTVPLTSGLVAQIFGPRYMATLFGIVFFSHQVGGFLGVWLGGRLFDLTGSYDIVWWISAALGIFSAIVHYPIDERPLVRAAPASA
ncbi:MFS transporter [Ferrovibrio sp. MS7]|uniref:MFS transporter n=1 Tax=Ferrovibrio plantarum TaxID=3119164 RepID=UPI003136B503